MKTTIDMESQNIEYKESWRDEYLKWICGFANAQGGVIYIGIDDSEKVSGIESSELHKLTEDIPNKVRDTMGIIVDVNVLSKDNKDYLEIVTESSNVPISYHGQFHYRSGSTKQELRGVALQNFILKKMGKSWDDVLHESATINDIDEKAIRYFLKKGVEAERITSGSLGDTPQEVLENLHLISEEGKLKNAALLMFAKCPQKFFTGVQFKIGRFGQDETDLMFQDVVEGNIIQMADGVIDVLKSKYLISPIHYEGMQRKEPLEIPEDAFREILYNAIMHKQYGTAPIQMRVYTDYIEIWNAGTLPEGLTIEKLFAKHSSQPRNLNIADAFYKAGFVESWGRGIKKITDGFSSKNLPIPKIEENCGGILVTIQRGKMSEVVGSNVGSLSEVKLTDRQKDICKLLLVNPKVSAKAMSEVLSVVQRTIERELSSMQKNGFIRHEGNTSAGRWIILERGSEMLKH